MLRWRLTRRGRVYQNVKGRGGDREGEERGEGAKRYEHVVDFIFLRI